MRFGKLIFAGLAVLATVVLAPGVAQAKHINRTTLATNHVSPQENIFQAILRNLGEAASAGNSALDRKPRAVDSAGSRLAGDLNGIVAASAARNGVPVGLVHRIIRVESGGRCSAENGIASGVMQVRPATAHGVGVYGNLHDCRTGVEAGVRYLRLALSRSGGSWSGAATLYNRGIGARPVHSHYAMMVMK